MIPDTEMINSQLMKASGEFTITILCRVFGISRSVFYYRRKRYEEYGLLQSRSKRPKRTRTIDEEVKVKIAELHRAHGWIAGAALDVFENEPPVESPLLNLQNVILTPHMGAYSYEAIKKMGDTATINLLNVLKGKRPLYRVN